MEQMGKVAAICLVGAVFAALLKKRGAEMGLLLSLTVVAVAGAALMQTVGQALSLLERFMVLGNFDAALFRPLIKTTGIAVISRLGSDLCRELLAAKGYTLGENYTDCGLLLFDRQRQDVHAGGSGCGCSASVLCAHLLPLMERGELKRVLFCPTGALMSPTSSQQGESIPGICHAVAISSRK